MIESERLDKNKRISETKRATIERHSAMSCKSYTVKIQSNKLSSKQKNELQLLFLEAKWLKNYVLSWCKQSEDNKPWKFNTKIKEITHKDKDMNDVSVELNQLSSQMKQSVVSEMVSNIRTISTLTKKGIQKGGHLKFVKEVKSINLKQYKVSYNIKSKNTVKIQGVHGKLYVNGLEQFINIPDIEYANARILNRPDGYYIQFVTFLLKENKNIINKNNIIGIDFGCATSLTLSNGLKINISVQESEHLKRLQRKFSKQKKGSKNWYKTLRKIKRAYQHQINIKNNLSNQIVSYLINAYDTIVIQDEQLHNWQKGNHGKAIQYSILGRIKSKLKSSGKCYVLSKWYPTSKLCTNCGQIHSELKLWDRVFKCDCGITTSDRDIHAAQNMIWFYYKDLNVPMEHRDIKPVEIQTSTLLDTLVSNNASYISMKQEAARSLA